MGKKVGVGDCWDRAPPAATPEVLELQRALSGVRSGSGDRAGADGAGSREPGLRSGAEDRRERIHEFGVHKDM